MIPDARNSDISPERVTALVKKSGLTQRQLSVLIGQDVRSIRRWMRGERRPPYVAVFALERLADESAINREIVARTAKNI